MRETCFISIECAFNRGSHTQGKAAAATTSKFIRDKQREVRASEKKEKLRAEAYHSVAAEVVNIIPGFDVKDTGSDGDWGMGGKDPSSREEESDDLLAAIDEEISRAETGDNQLGSAKDAKGKRGWDTANEEEEEGRETKTDAEDDVQELDEEKSMDMHHGTLEEQPMDTITKIFKEEMTGEDKADERGGKGGGDAGAEAKQGRAARLHARHPEK